MSRVRASPGLSVVVETGRKRVFASVLDWPGWCRSGRTEEAALEALATYAARYAPVAAAAGLDLPPADRMVVVEHLPGDATTDFGAPGAVADAERAGLTRAEAAAQADLLVAAWATLDAVGKTAPPTLRKGPRGGGRDRDKVLQHVYAAEAAYARKVGLRFREPAFDDDAAVAALHAALDETVRGARGGTPSTERGWPPRYAVRRVTWHVLDHAWEIEDRSHPEGPSGAGGPGPRLEGR
jgi:hypothetical protein